MAGIDRDPPTADEVQQRDEKLARLWRKMARITRRASSCANFLIGLSFGLSTLIILGSITIMAFWNGNQQIRDYAGPRPDFLDSRLLVTSFAVQASIFFLALVGLVGHLRALTLEPDERDGMSQRLRPLGASSSNYLRTVVEQLCVRMAIPSEHLRLWIDSRNPSISPSVYEVEYGGLRPTRSVNLVVPLGFMKVLSTDLECARAMLAHELGHVRGGDSKLWAISTAYTRIFHFFVISTSAALGFDVFASFSGDQGYFQAYRVAGGWRGSSILGSGMRHLIPIAVFLTFFWLMRRYRRMSEAMADLTAVHYVGAEPLARALSKFQGHGPILDWFSVHPSIEKRLTDIARQRRD